MKTAVTIYSANQYFAKGKMDVEGFINYCSSIGVDAVDLGYYWKDEEKEIKQVPDWLRKVNMKLGCYIVGNDFAQRDNKTKEEMINKVKHAIDRSSQLGVNKLRVFVGDIKQDIPVYEDVRDILVDCFKKVCDYAETKKVILALENHGKLCAKPLQILDLVASVKSDNLKMNIDVGNFMSVGENPVDSISKLIHLAVHVHIKDFKKIGDEIIPTIVGEGDVDLEACLKIFKKNNFKGYLSIEFEGKEDSKIGIEKSLINLRRVLAKM